MLTLLAVSGWSIVLWQNRAKVQAAYNWTLSAAAWVRTWFPAA